MKNNNKARLRLSSPGHHYVEADVLVGVDPGKTFRTILTMKMDCNFLEHINDIIPYLGTFNENAHCMVFSDDDKLLLFSGPPTECIRFINGSLEEKHNNEH